MILSGDEIVIISRDDLQKIFDALVCNRTRADYERLEQMGLLHIVEDLRRVLRESEIHDD